MIAPEPKTENVAHVSRDALSGADFRDYNRLRGVGILPDAPDEAPFELSLVDLADQSNLLR